MKIFGEGLRLLGVFAAAVLVAHADTFTIERNDPRPFRIHRGPDETAATQTMIDELAREVKRVTGVSVAIKGYDTANETPKLAEVKHVHRNLVVSWPSATVGRGLRPRRVRNGEPLTVVLWNRFSFTPSGAFDARWELLEDGLPVANGALDWPSVPPLTKREMKVTLPKVKVKPDAEYFLNVSFHLKSSAFVGRWSGTVTGQYVPYCRPQDNGYKCDVRWAAFTDGDGKGVRAKGDMPLFVQALHYVPIQPEQWTVTLSPQ